MMHKWAFSMSGEVLECFWAAPVIVIIMEAALSYKMTILF
jgi:hypothetical protein